MRRRHTDRVLLFVRVLSINTLGREVLKMKTAHQNERNEWNEHDKWCMSTSQACKPLICISFSLSPFLISEQ